MAKLKNEDGGKLEILHVKITPRVKFALTLLAQKKRQSMTAALEEAIETQAEKLDLGTPWTTLYDPDAGVRALNLFALKTYRLSPEEEDVRIFVRAHREFFYADPQGTAPKRAYVAVLWPKLQHYLQTWRDTRATDATAAAHEMAAALKKANIQPPKVK